MDMVTQGLLGGVLGQAVAKPEEKKIATLVAALAGMLADADIFIRSGSDPLLNIEYHRHFTHSIFFIPIGAAIAMALLWPFMRKRLEAKRLYLFCLAGYSLSGMLDLCTSYGTHLFWPLSDERVSLNIISIVDPIFTLILLVAMVIGLRRPNLKAAHIGMVFCFAYLGFAGIQNYRATQLAELLIQQRGHAAERLVVKPTLANLVLWRSIYIYDNHIYVDAIRPSLFGKSKIYAGQWIPLFKVEEHFPELAKDSILYKDMQRFAFFSDGYVGIDPMQKNIIGDIRYSMLPLSVKPLWGIVYDINKPDEHADYRFFRENSGDLRTKFVRMLFELDE